MKNIRIKKLLTAGYPVVAILVGIILGYATIFFVPYQEALRLLAVNNDSVMASAQWIQYIGIVGALLVTVLAFIRDHVENRSILFSIFGLSYLASLAYFSSAIIGIITQFSWSLL